MNFFPPCGRINRRNLLVDCGMGFAGLALTAMLRRDGLLNAAETPSWTHGGRRTASLISRRRRRTSSGFSCRAGRVTWKPSIRSPR